MSHEIRLRQIKGKEGLKAFVRFGQELYKDNPYYVPQLISEEVMTLDEDRNPAFEFCEAVYYMAYKGDRAVGKIAGIINHRANETWNQAYARFGFVDFIDDPEVSRRLFQKVEQWALSKGMDTIHGPMGFTDLDHQGMLVWGFDQLGTMAAIYNYPYYPEHLQRLGYERDQDWKEFLIKVPEKIPEKHLRIADIVQRKYKLKVMKFKKVKEILPYAKSIFHTLNRAYAPLYGVSELSPEQIDYYVKMYIPLLRLDLVTVVSKVSDGEVIGFAITLPNLSRAMQKAKGKLWPLGAVHLLKALKSRPKVVDLYLIGILPEYQNKGINTLLFRDLIPIYQELGVPYCESNPELESNLSVRMQWNYFEKIHHKTRSAFIKALD